MRCEPGLDLRSRFQSPVKRQFLWSQQACVAAHSILNGVVVVHQRDDATVVNSPSPRPVHDDVQAPNVGVYLATYVSCVNSRVDQVVVILNWRIGIIPREALWRTEPPKPQVGGSPPRQSSSQPPASQSTLESLPNMFTVWCVGTYPPKRPHILVWR